MKRTLRLLKNVQIVTRELGRTIKIMLGTAAGIYGAFEIVRKVIK